MEYEEFIESYSKELQLLDAIDLLKHLSPESLDILNLREVESKDGKSDELRDQTDPTLWISSQGIQLLWFEGVHQYTYPPNLRDKRNYGNCAWWK